MNTPKLRDIPKGKEKKGLSLADAWVNVVKDSVRKVFIPYGSLEQFKESPLFMRFLKENMIALQKEGYNFTDAFMEVAKRWNNSPAAQSEGFRMTTNLGPTKSHRVSGRLVKVENEVHIKKVLGIDDYRTESICKAFGLSVKELWPEKIVGKNQYSPGKARPNIVRGKNQYKKKPTASEILSRWWESGWKERYAELLLEKKSSEEAILEACREYNAQQVSKKKHLDTEELLRIYKTLLLSE